MAEKTPSNDLEYSRQLQEKFELYLLALIFTLLGLAVQTAKFGTNTFGDILELLGWLFLLASGLVGLSRLEWLPVAYKTNANLKNLEAEHNHLKEAAAAGVQDYPVLDQAEPAHIDALIEDRSGAIKTVQGRLNELERTILRKYSIHKWLFVVGLTLLIGARGYPPVHAILKQQLTVHSSGQPTAAPSSADEFRR